MTKPLFPPQATLLLVLISLFSQPGYSQQTEDTLSLVDDPNDCITVNGYYDCNTCACNFTDSVIIMSISFAFLSILCSGLLIVGYLSVKQMREKPGDILFVLALCDVIYSGSTIVDSFLELNQPDKLMNNSPDCEVIGYIKVMTLFVINFYHVAFCVFYLLMLKGSLKSLNVPSYIYHIGPILAGAAITYYTGNLGGIGRSIYGTCQEKTAPGLWFALLRYGIILVIILFVSYYMKKYLPENGNINTLRNSFLSYYFKFLMVLVVVYLLNGTTDAMAGTLADNIVQHQENSEYIGNLTWIKKVKSVLNAVMPLVLTLARFKEPVINEHWKKIFRSCVEKYRQRHSTAIDPRRVSLDLATVQRSLSKKTYVFQFQHSQRVQVVYSLLSGIHYFWHIKQEIKSSGDLNSTSRSLEESFLEGNQRKGAYLQQSFVIDKDIMTKAVPELFDEIKGKQYNLAAGTFTVYAPHIFEEIIELDDIGRGIRKSLDLKANFNRILKSGINGGGKSGEFFFFSNDNKIILKTVSDSELKVLLNILPAYLKHFKENPESLIAKIYGVFTLKLDTPQEKYHLILMRNINGLPTLYVKRKYDLKGSTDGRRAVKEEGLTLDELLIYPDLKDLDFDRYEGKIQISPNMCFDLYETLRRDAEFLASQNLVDYSVALYIVDKDKYLSKKRNYGGSDEDISMSFDSTSPSNRGSLDEYSMISNMDHKNRFFSMKSTQEDYYYHMGIIDYLITFGFKKKMEVFFRKLIKLNPNRDISVQRPSYYGSRFEKYMKRILKVDEYNLETMGPRESSVTVNLTEAQINPE